MRLFAIKNNELFVVCRKLFIVTKRGAFLNVHQPHYLLITAQQCRNVNK